MKMNDEFRTKEVQEVTELINLAEKVSEQVNSYRVQRSKSTTQLINIAFVFAVVTFICLAIGINVDFYYYRKYLIYFYVLIFIIYSSISVVFYRNYVNATKVKREVIGEAQILRRLLDMIYSLSSGLGELSLVEKALIDMRLSRVKFSLSGLNELDPDGRIEDVNLEILQATYGDTRNRLDATLELNRLIQNNRLEFVGDNYLVGDPSPGNPKNWKITYKVGGLTFTREYPEGAKVVIVGG